jgi:hypothetical protein
MAYFFKIDLNEIGWFVELIIRGTRGLLLTGLVIWNHGQVTIELN